MNTTHSLRSTLSIAVLALLCSGLQIAGIDSLATPRGARVEAQVVQLPTVLVSAERTTASPPVRQLPRVVIVGRRGEAEGAVTALADVSRRAI
jgi:hypothetical protein